MSPVIPSQKNKNGSTGVLRHFRGRQDRWSKKWVLNEFLNSDGRKSKNQQEKITDEISEKRNFGTWNHESRVAY